MLTVEISDNMVPVLEASCDHILQKLPRFTKSEMRRLKAAIDDLPTHDLWHKTNMNDKQTLFERVVNAFAGGQKECLRNAVCKMCGLEGLFDFPEQFADFIAPSAINATLLFLVQLYYRP